MGHDVTRLGTAAIKRRYPPGMVPGQQLEEITLVQSDIEGSTEIWEWYDALHLCICLGASPLDGIHRDLGMVRCSASVHLPWYIPTRSSCFHAQVLKYVIWSHCCKQDPDDCHRHQLLYGTFNKHLSKSLLRLVSYCIAETAWSNRPMHPNCQCSVSSQPGVVLQG